VHKHPFDSSDVRGVDGEPFTRALRQAYNDLEAEKTAALARVTP
jgi:hypothetical protein